MPKLSKCLFLTLVLCGFTNVAQAAPILISSGESAIFKFDFSPTDISAADHFSYIWNTTGADGSAIAFFEMTFNLFDELGEAPIFSHGPDLYSPSLLLSGVFPPLTSDPISYLEVSFLSADGIAPSSVLMSITAEAYQNGEFGELIQRVDGVASSVPVPATTLLLCLALYGLALSRCQRTDAVHL